jgi:excisionase family DNA binding protein
VSESAPHVPVESKLLLSPPEASALTGIGRDQVYRFCQDGTWPAIRVGVRFMIPRTSITRWIARETEAPEEPTPASPLRPRRAARP